MKKLIIPVLTLLCYFATVKYTLSQIQFFDSIKTVVSSSIYDYKNPRFSNNPAGYFNAYSWLVYERHNGSSSDIVCRKARYGSYGSEIVISNTSNVMNINPSIDHTISYGMIVWQSNVSGNWDLYYSVLINDSTWSPPLAVVNSLSDESKPYISNNYTDPVQYNYFYLTYNVNNSIRFIRYKTSTGVWNNDTIVTDGTYEDFNPVITKGNSASQYGLVFQRKISASKSRLYQRLFYENYSSTVTWNNLTEIYQPNSQNNLSKSFSSSIFLTYSYDTLSSNHILGFELNGQSNKIVITRNVPGKHIAGKGSVMGIITDAGFYYFSAFSALSRNSDSLFFTFINRPASFNEFPEYKKVYLGDTNTVTRFDVSQPIFQEYLFYRIKTVWEKTAGGRTELVESYMTDRLEDIRNNNSLAEGFYLEQNYPNPFNPVTNLEFGISDLGFVSLKVYNVSGKEVKTLVNENKLPGNYDVEFDGSDLPSGVYFYKLEASSYVVSKRMILIK